MTTHTPPPPFSCSKLRHLLGGGRFGKSDDNDEVKPGLDCNLERIRFSCIASDTVWFPKTIVSPYKGPESVALPLPLPGGDHQRLEEVVQVG